MDIRFIIIDPSADSPSYHLRHSMSIIDTTNTINHHHDDCHHHCILLQPEQARLRLGHSPVTAPRRRMRRMASGAAAKRQPVLRARALPRKRPGGAPRQGAAQLGKRKSAIAVDRSGRAAHRPSATDVPCTTIKFRSP